MLHKLLGCPSMLEEPTQGSGVGAFFFSKKCYFGVNRLCTNRKDKDKLGSLTLLVVVETVVVKKDIGGVTVLCVEFIAKIGGVDVIFNEQEGGVDNCVIIDLEQTEDGR